MKKLVNLSTLLVNEFKEPFKDTNNKPFLIKQSLLSVVMNIKEVQPAQTLRIYNKIGPMIEAAKQSIELEDADYQIVKKAVEQAPLALFVKAQLLMTLEENQEKNGPVDK